MQREHIKSAEELVANLRELFLVFCLAADKRIGVHGVAWVATFGYRVGKIINLGFEVYGLVMEYESDDVKGRMGIGRTEVPSLAEAPKTEKTADHR